MASASNPAQSQVMGGLPPPPGVAPDFNNPTLGYVVASVAICLTITTLVVWIRMYTVFFVIKSHGWADCKSLPRMQLLFLANLTRHVVARLGKPSTSKIDGCVNILIADF